MINKRKAGFTKKAKERNQKSRHTTNLENSRFWHCDTIQHRITEASKGAQYGTLKIPLGAKVTNDMSGRDSETSCLSRGTPRTLTNAFSDRTPGDPIQGRANGTREQTCTHPRTTKTMEQTSDCPSEFDLVFRVDPDLKRGPLKRDLTLRAHSVES
ncbi:hypothetical protein CDL15_Pgr000879 [Punica granatum]|uniref:Uncharacterized protein n=1 Tax=Punica granatum TaxID=22663 RepID=A0A218Y0L8_PUNGR|nr:hypothetical protein CDL15_Pgr000879 [Punica granatum]PKI57894.1 hypothetical protein CRG98_021733 [Punica granatum]